MDDFNFRLGEQGEIEMLNGDEIVEFSPEAVSAFLSKDDKYAGVVRATTQNKTVRIEKDSTNRKTHFGIR